MTQDTSTYYVWMIVLQIETHNLATEAMDETRKEFHQKNVSHNYLVGARLRIAGLRICSKRCYL